MKKLLLTLAMSLIIIATVSAQEFSCASDLAEQSAMANYPNYTRDRQSSLLFADHYRNRSTFRMLNIGCQRTAATYKIPIVFHVVHLGEAVGMGTNIPDTQIINSLARMNQYWTQLGVEFIPAKQDQFGNPIINGIDRVSGLSVPNYENFGIDIRSNPVGAQDTTIKKLKRLPYQFCINVWIVNKIATGSPYSNMPSGYEFQGIVITGPGISARSSLSHEMGHYMGLYHTFHGSSGSTCASNSDPYQMGDFCADTPPLLQSDCGGSSSCGIFTNILNSWKNIMGYCAGGNLFTPDQKILVMAALFSEFRWGLVQSAALNPVNVPLEVSVDSIAFVQNTALAICDGKLDTKAQFINYSANTVDSIKVHFKLGNLDTVFTARNAGGFLRGSNWLIMPMVRFTSSGNYTAEVEFILDDYNPMNNNQCLSVDVVVQTITISTNVNIVGAGTLSGSGSFSCNGVVDTLRATENIGYVFQSITEGSTVISTSRTFPLPIDLSRGNRVFIANFAVATYSVSATANPSNGGTVTSGIGTYNYGATPVVTFKAKAGYKLTNVTENGNQVSTDSSVALPALTGNRNLVGNFVLKTFSINVTASGVGGTASGGGSSIFYGTSITVTATEFSCYNFSGWYENGSLVSPNKTYTFTVTNARNLEARFTQKQFVIAAASSNDALGTVSGGDTYGCGTTATVRAHVKPGGKFVNWTDNATGLVVFTDSIYPFQASINRILIANFQQVQLVKVNAGADQAICFGDSVTLTASNSTDYLWSNGVSIQSIRVSPAVTTSYVVTGLNGTKDTVKVTIKPLPNVAFTKVINGSSVQFTAPGGNSTYSWDFGDTQTSSEQNPLHTYSSNGKKYVTLSSTLNGCNAVKTDSVIVNNVATGITNHSTEIESKIYPNPTSSFLRIEIISLDIYNAKIYSIAGDLLWSDDIVKQLTVDVSGFAKGIYILKLDDGEGSITSKQFIVN
jgi:hypothetical protein